jgi:hypothetical protein
VLYSGKARGIRACLPIKARSKKEEPEMDLNMEEITMAMVRAKVKMVRPVTMMATRMMMANEGDARSLCFLNQIMQQ